MTLHETDFKFIHLQKKTENQRENILVNRNIYRLDFR